MGNTDEQPCGKACGNAALDGCEGVHQAASLRGRARRICAQTNVPIARQIDYRPG